MKIKRFIGSKLIPINLKTDINMSSIIDELEDKSPEIINAKRDNTVVIPMLSTIAASIDKKVIKYNPPPNHS